MAYFSGLVRSTLSTVGFGGPAPGFPYHVGEPVADQDDQAIWTLHKGTKREDQSEVSIFVFNSAQHRELLPLAKNAYKRFRTIRHPNLLTFLDGVENADTIYIVTNPVLPLRQHLRDHRDDQLTLWGLYKVAQAVKFLNDDCKLVHGNLRTASVYVTLAGEWRLGGLETLCSPTEPEAIIRTYHGLLPQIQTYAPPEVRNQNWATLDNGSLDAWQLATLIYESYNQPLTSPDDLEQPGCIPVPLVRAYKQLVLPSPTARGRVAQFLTTGTRPNGFFENEFIHTNLFLENMSIKEAGEKAEFFRQLGPHVDSFPISFSVHKVLPELLKTLEFAAGGPQVLQAVLKIGQRLDEDQFVTSITPTLIRLFALPDRALRFCLLEHLGVYVTKIADRTVNDVIYPHIATGFIDAAPAIREQTVKAVLVLAPKLSKSTLQGDVVNALGRAAGDREPGIRTNALVCLGKLDNHLSNVTHRDLVGPLLVRGLRDPFPHARSAALMAVAATSSRHEAKDLTGRLLPAACSVLLDQEKVVRTQALKAVQNLLATVDKLASAMPDTAQPKTGTDAGPDRVPSEGSLQEGWSGWAVSSLSRGLTALGTNMTAAPLTHGAAQSTPTTPSLSSTAPVDVTEAKPATTRKTIPPTAAAAMKADDGNADVAGDGWDAIGDFTVDDASNWPSAAAATPGSSHTSDWDTPVTSPRQPLATFGASAAPYQTGPASTGNNGVSVKDDDFFSTGAFLPITTPKTSSLSGIKPASTLQQRREERKLKLQQHREQKLKKGGGLGAKKA
ncbi:Nuclear aminoacylation-dependent tRNA export pathway component [Tieghemiomyces parasiticus]|uniref:Nuclear aminoacylation-dependent tRNA export pathway component n=1 Tax=Tieghemiomyces parasiticus TaxID=78921 RepID=A0A9W8AI47_9FUNG|nr:Nuclear aminoacylation-dependent tRNA export pathway component [Tieghemiomyces parasiticus]